MLETLFIIGVFANLLKAGDLLLREHQKQKVQSAMEALTLWLDYTRPIRWYAALARPRVSFWWALFSAIFIIGSFLTLPLAAASGCLGGALAFLFDLLIESARALRASRTEAIVLALVAIATSVALAYGPGGRLVQWVHGGGRPWPFLGRLFLLYATTVGTFFGLRYAAITARDLPILRYAVLITWPLAFALLVPNAAGLLMITLVFLLWIAETLLKLLRGISWRIVEYSKGAYAAIVLLATVAIGIYELITRLTK